MLLTCEECKEDVGLLSGVVEKFLCLECASEKAFGGKDQSSSQPKSVVQGGNAPSPVPANPVVVTEVIPPATTGGSLPTEATTPSRPTEPDDVMTPSEIRESIQNGRRLPKHEYACLVAYATAFKANALYRRSGTVGLFLSKYAVWTDTEIAEALR